jgi:hypothetical protein
VVCKCCGVEAPTKYVEFHQNIGTSLVRYRLIRYRKKVREEVKGNLCRSCIQKYFWKFTSTNLTLGWWGVTSFFQTPFLVLSNLIYYLRTLDWQRVSAGKTVRTGTKQRHDSIGESRTFEPRQTSRSNPTPAGSLSDDCPKISFTPSGNKPALPTNSTPFSDLSKAPGVSEPLLKPVQVSNPSPVPFKPPVRERDRQWYNTRDAGPLSLPEPAPSAKLSIEDLIKSLGCSNNSEFRRLAAELLGERGAAAAPAISALLIACIDINATVRNTALNALEAIDPNWPKNPEVQKAFPRLTEEFKKSYCFRKSYSEEVSQATYELLQQIGEPAVPFLGNLIAEQADKIEYKIRAIWLLKTVGLDAASAVPELIKALSNPSSQVRIEAANALARFGSDVRPQGIIPNLIAGLADRNEDVRKAMMACLLATKPTVSDLTPFLEDQNPRIRRAMVHALGQIKTRRR